MTNCDSRTSRSGTPYLTIGLNGMEILQQAIDAFVAHRQYDSFGNVTDESGPAVDFIFGYTGKAWDADAELYDYYHRMYDPVVGRFASADPLGLASGDANLYRYVGNNPLNNVDPTGLCSIKTTADSYLFNSSPIGPMPSTTPGSASIAPVSEIRAYTPSWYESAWDTVKSFFVPTGRTGLNPVQNFVLDTVHPAVVAGGQNSARLAQGSARALGGGAGTMVTGGPALVGVPYAGEAFDASTELARRGVSDVGASLGFGGDQWGDTLTYGNIGPSSAAQFMQEVRNSPGVSPLVYNVSAGSEIVGDISWAAAQGVQGTRLGSMNLLGSNSNVAGLNARQASTLRQMLMDIPGVKDVRAFGSRTTGMSTSASDLDVLLIGDVPQTSRAAIDAITRARAYARSVGIGAGKTGNYLDPQVFPTLRAAQQSFRANPLPPPAKSVPIFKKLK